ncbi:DUF2304 domain-containing protein [Rothia nasimurium]|uniref:DUF2304 domain-containing protein n=1 Tax=Rothia nasimurium TaxID=85336 RepID=UPI001F1DFAD7|nr:DUF2304 domain-containing protein [Rothia nasimurium]
MSTNSYIFFLIFAAVIVLLVLAQVRNQNMKEKYAALWLIVSAIIIVLVIFPRLLLFFADFIGIESPVNLLFLLSIIMLIGVSLHLTVALSKTGEDVRVLAEEIAILRAQFDQQQMHSEAKQDTRDRSADSF